MRKYKFRPYSKNIIFFDTEFSSMDPYKGEILSIGMITFDGRELYLELEYEGEVDPWVEENIIPTLKSEKVSRQKAVEIMKKFVGKEKPYIVIYVVPYDAVYMYKLFGNMKTNPFYWIPLDFASILFSLGINPEAYFPRDKENFFRELGIDASKYREHNALDDARLLREVYLKMVEKNV